MLLNALKISLSKLFPETALLFNHLALLLPRASGLYSAPAAWRRAPVR
jgi:hypothetical protein